METREPKIDFHGPIATHDLPCAVHYLVKEPAVFDLNSGVFHPSWAAQEQGWHIIKADTWYKKLALRVF